jgi:hypothetical protein
MTYSFAFKCSYLNSTYYTVTPEGQPSFEVEYRWRLSDYEASIYNGGPEKYRADCTPRIMALLSVTAPVTLTLLAAFNMWVRREHEASLAQMRAMPERYGPESDWRDHISAPACALSGIWYDADGCHTNVL